MRYPNSPFGSAPSDPDAAVAGSFGAAAEITLLTGGTVAKDTDTKNLLIDTFADAASDDLTNITGYDEGDLILVRAAHTDRTVVMKDGANMNLQSDFSLSNTERSMILLNIGSNKWTEFSRAAN